MNRLQSNRRFQIAGAQPVRFDDGNASETLENDDEDQELEDRNVTEDQQRVTGDYINALSRHYIMKILKKQGDKKVLFADRVLKFTGSGKMQRRILLITDFAIYIVDQDTDALKRRIALAAVEQLCLSELTDNFFAIIIPTEYDLLMASTRKTEIVSTLVEALKNTSDYELEVVRSNRFVYHAAADLVKEVQSEEVEGGVKTRIVRK